MKLISVNYLFLFILPCMSDLLNNARKNVKLPPCEACNKLATSFKKGIKRTSRGNFAGGDTAWEEEKLGSYYRSEVRLVEIQEKLCLDVDDGEAQCHSLAEEAESLLEDWWFQEQDSNSNLQDWLCVSNMKLCCPEGHYGADCKECPGYPDICTNNGKCKGAGTRTGNGNCICNPGYAGKFCEHCATDYFEISQNPDNKILCSACHKSCQGGCSDDTAKGCKSCKKGWQMEANVGCTDVDECKTLENTCKNDEMCVNIEGSYTCKVAVHRPGDPGKWARYATYVSFCIASVAFLRKSLLFGSLVTLATAVYISASEIVMNDVSLSGVDVKKYLSMK